MVGDRFGEGGREIPLLHQRRTDLRVIRADDLSLDLVEGFAGLAGLGDRVGFGLSLPHEEDEASDVVQQSAHEEALDVVLAPVGRHHAGHHPRAEAVPPVRVHVDQVAGDVAEERHHRCREREISNL